MEKVGISTLRENLSIFLKKVQKGQVITITSRGHVLESNKYVFLGITPEIAALSTDLLSDNNKDPADRIIAATSIIENAKLVTADKKLRQSKKVATIW